MIENYVVEDKLKNWNKYATIFGSIVTSSSDMHYGAIHGYVAAVADIFGEDQAFE